MKYTSILSIPVLLAVSACSSIMGHHGKATPKALQPTAPSIAIVESASGKPAMVLDQEPLVLTKEALAVRPITDPVTGKTGIPIVWTIDPKAGWEFDPERGIVFETPPQVPADISKRYGLEKFITFDNPENDIFGCRRLDDPTKYQCLTTSVTSTVYKQFKYSLHLRSTSVPSNKITLDPILWR